MTNQGAAPQTRAGKLQYLRKSKGLSLADVSKICAAHGEPVSRTAIWGLEQEAKNNFEIELLRRVARALDTDVISLLDDSVTIKEMEERRNG